MKKERLIQWLKQIPIWVWVVWILFALTAIVHFFSFLSPAFADGVSGSVGYVLRAALGYLTAVFPFSLAEIILLALPIEIPLVILLVRRRLKKCSPIRIVSGFLSFLPILYILFVFSLGVGYGASSLDEKMNLSVDDEITETDLFATAEWLARQAEKELAQLRGSEMPVYNEREMNEALIRAYDALAEEYDFIKSFSVGVKPILLSQPMAYTGISGIYSFFTGEANLNTSYPQYSDFFTAAHEMAHARGFSRENEANFVAFLVLSASEDPYLRYAGYANLLQYVLSALSRTDDGAFVTLYTSLPVELKAEYKAYYEYIYTIDDSVVREISDAVNDAYLKGVGGEGVISYGMVVTLAVSFYKAQ